MARTAVTEGRIEHIANLMRRLEWHTGKSGRALAKKWDLSLSSLEKLSAVASKQVRAEIVDPEEVTITVAAALDRVMREALDDGDRRSVIQAAATWARIVGADAPSRHEVKSVEPVGLRLFLPVLEGETLADGGSPAPDS